MAGQDQDPTSKAQTVCDHARDSVRDFTTAFEIIRSTRGQGRGRTGHAEQDQLRAALVFAAAGLDSTLKELIREALPFLVVSDGAVKRELETFVARQIRGEGGEPEANYGTKFLAKILTADSLPILGIIEQYVLELTGSSLQSADQVMKTLRALGVNPDRIVSNIPLKAIFSIRNQIIHELDVNLRAQQGKRNRNDRSRDEMTKYSNMLLDIAQGTIDAVKSKLDAAGKL